MGEQGKKILASVTQGARSLHQLPYFSSIGRNFMVAVSELMKTPARGRARRTLPSIVLTSHLLKTQIGSYNSRRGRYTVLRTKCGKRQSRPSELSQSHLCSLTPISRLVTVWAGVDTRQAVFISVGFHTLSIRVGCPSSLLGLEGLYLLSNTSSNVRVRFVLARSSGLP